MTGTTLAAVDPWASVADPPCPHPAAAATTIAAASVSNLDQLLHKLIIIFPVL